MSDKMQADFQPWHGDRPFRGDKLLRVKFRNGRVSKDALPASKWRGKWGGVFPDDFEFDIIGVRPE